MSPAIPSVTARDVKRALGKLGFTHVSTRGSHAKLVHPDGRQAIVPQHGSRDIPRGTVASILRQAEISVTDFVKHL